MNRQIEYIHGLFKPEFVEMKKPLSSFDAARMVAEVPRHLTKKQLKLQHPEVWRFQSQIQKAALVYEDAELSDADRLEYGIPSAWDGGTRVFETFQIKQWKQRKYSRTKNPRYRGRQRVRTLIQVTTKQLEAGGFDVVAILNGIRESTLCKDLTTANAQMMRYLEKFQKEQTNE